MSFFQLETFFLNLHHKVTKCLGAAKTCLLPVNFLKHFTPKLQTNSKEIRLCIYVLSFRKKDY